MRKITTIIVFIICSGMLSNISYSQQDYYHSRKNERRTNSIEKDNESYVTLNSNTRITNLRADGTIFTSSDGGKTWQEKDYGFLTGNFKIINKRTKGIIHFSNDGGKTWNQCTASNKDEAEITEFSDLDFKIFPNPGLDDINLVFNQSINISGKIVIYNILGNKIYSEYIDYFGYQYKISISKLDLSKGLYFVKVSILNKSKIRKMLIK